MHLVERGFGSNEEISFLLVDWQQFYSELFGAKVDFSSLVVPERKRGFDRLIIVAQEMTPQRFYDKCAEFFLCWRWAVGDLNKIVRSKWTAENSSYAAWFRDIIEPDEDLENLSANDLEREEISGITLEERLLMELKYFKETGEHLDRENMTLCSGSRFSGGYIPKTFWNPKFFKDYVPRVYWRSNIRTLLIDGYHPAGSDSNLRFRRAIR